MGLGRRAAQAYLDDPRHVSEATVRLPTRDIMDEHFARCHQEAVSLARDCLLALVADAKRFDEDIDGDETGMSVRYFIETDHHSLGELAEVLGIRAGFGETVGDALWRAIGTDPASAMSARQGQDPKGLEAQPASAVPQADAQ
jgi:class 3 adenylate cyclase